MFRQPRPGEEDGRDYHYVTRETMQGLIDENQFIENAKFRSVEHLTFEQGEKMRIFLQWKHVRNEQECGE